mgnify:CR=1 FL=1
MKRRLPPLLGFVLLLAPLISVAAAEEAFAARLAHNGIARIDGPPTLAGEPERIADRLRPYVALGFRTFIVRLPLAASTTRPTDLTPAH